MTGKGARAVQAASFGAAADALTLLHQRAAEERMARSVDEFYGGTTAPLPVGVRPAAGDVTPDAAT